MTTPGFAQAARRLADQQKAQALAPPADGPTWATVVTVTAGAAPRGKALVTVLWRGSVVTANDYFNSYTPVPNDRVLCMYITKQLIIMGSTT